MSNREKMPSTASMLDELRTEFGDARLIYAAEGDYEVGTEVQTRAVGTTASGAEVREETGRRHIGREAVSWLDAEAEALVVAAQQGRTSAALETLQSRYSAHDVERIRQRGRELWQQRRAA